MTIEAAGGEQLHDRPNASGCVRVESIQGPSGAVIASSRCGVRERALLDARDSAFAWQ